MKRIYLYLKDPQNDLNVMVEFAVEGGIVFGVECVTGFKFHPNFDEILIALKSLVGHTVEDVLLWKAEFAAGYIDQYYCRMFVPYAN